RRPRLQESLRRRPGERTPRGAPTAPAARRGPTEFPSAEKHILCGRSPGQVLRRPARIIFPTGSSAAGRRDRSSGGRLALFLQPGSELEGEADDPARGADLHAGPEAVDVAREQLAEDVAAVDARRVVHV